LGDETFAYVEAPGTKQGLPERSAQSQEPSQVGRILRLAVPEQAAHLFNAEGIAFRRLSEQDCRAVAALTSVRRQSRVNSHNRRLPPRQLGEDHELSKLRCLCVGLAVCGADRAAGAATITLSCGAVGKELELCKQGAEAWAKIPATR
jgi:hypothetical protein